MMPDFAPVRGSAADVPGPGPAAAGLATPLSVCRRSGATQKTDRQRKEPGVSVITTELARLSGRSLTWWWRP